MVTQTFAIRSPR